MQQIFGFDALEEADLVVDALYQGGTAGNAGDDPLHKLLGCGLQGGIRYIGSSRDLSCKLVVIYSSLSDPDWPDYLDVQTGQFTYFGDNKTPGYDLHGTSRKGNIIFRDSFGAYHSGKRDRVPPFFIFTKGDEGRDVVFKGLAVPGSPGLAPTEDLIAIWKSRSGQRFQNYQAVFTVLDVPVMPRAWITDIRDGNTLTGNCPGPWKGWVQHSIYTPLRAEKAIVYRKKEEQLRLNPAETRLIQAIYEHFMGRPHDFERCAAELVKLMDTNVVSCDVTRPWKDGGRDAVGKYRIGLEDNLIEVDFALEAKCYSLTHGAGIRDTSRLISRLKYRQFGIFVTTSYISLSAYKELIEDQHPVIVVCALDIVNILKRAGYNTKDALDGWLTSNFPRSN